MSRRPARAPGPRRGAADPGDIPARRVRAERRGRRRRAAPERPAAARRRMAAIGAALRARAGVLSACLALGLGAPAAVWGTAFVLPAAIDHPYFALRDVRVTPTARVAAPDLLAWAGIRPGTSLWRHDPAALAARLAAHPWIRRAEVRRELPRRLVIRLEEERPAAIVLVEELYYVNARGEPFARLDEHAPLDLPLVTGIEAALLEGDGVFTRHAVRHALRLVARMRDAGLPFRVSEVHVERDAGLTVFPVAPRLTLRFGWRQLAVKLDRLRDVLRAYAGREDGIRQIDLTYAAQAVVQWGRSGA